MILREKWTERQMDGNSILARTAEIIPTHGRRFHIDGTYLTRCDADAGWLVDELIID
jgi:hypothetical protein